ncbi:MAG: helix-turn-helix transcriptional regulator [Bacteroidota bacterium]
MKGTYLGEFEEIVLLTVALMGDQAYGVAIRKELEAQADRKVSIGAVHAACNRLEDKGFLRAKFGESSPRRGGKRKKIYRVTQAGQAALTKSRELRESLWNQLPPTAFDLNISWS